MDRSICARRTLAAGAFSVVEQCTCGAVHVTIGAVTLRLTASAIAPIGETLVEAARALGHEPAPALRMSPEVLS
jgi:hypothetical protein